MDKHSPKTSFSFPSFRGVGGCLMIILFCLLPLALHAETKDERLAHRHEVRVLVGDMIMETFLWKDQLHANYLGCGTDKSVFAEKRDYTYTPHIGLEYQYRLNKWLGLGLQTDYQRTAWRRCLYNNRNEEVGSSREHFYNLSLLPTVRFTYLNARHVSLHSSLSLGMDINGGTEKAIHGRNTAVGFALNIGLIGVSVNFGQWFGAFDLGGLYALKSVGTLYMVNSRAFTLSFGYRL